MMVGACVCERWRHPHPHGIPKKGKQKRGEEEMGRKRLEIEEEGRLGYEEMLLQQVRRGADEEDVVISWWWWW